MKKQKGRLLPFVLLLAILLSLGQAAFMNAGSGANVARAADTTQGDPTTVFLPSLFRGYVSDSVFGIDLGPISTSTGLTQMKAANTTWVRRGNFLWPTVEPNKGDRNWSAVANFDSELTTASGNGFKTILVIQNAPSWALANPSGAACGPIKPEEYATFASFVHDLVARYSQPPYNVKYFEIGNEEDAPAGVEPNQVFGCWGDTSDPTYYGGKAYGDMLKVVYPQVKAANSDAQVLIGGILLGKPPTVDASGKFLSGVLAEGAGSSFDVMSIHAYDYDYSAQTGAGTYGNTDWNAGWNSSGQFINGPTINAKLAYLKDLFKQYNVPAKPVIATELALLSLGSTDSKFELTKAAYVAESYTYALVDGLMGGIWYDTMGNWAGKHNGLLNADLTPLPAYNAYKTAERELDGMVYSREVTTYKDAKVYEFKRGTTVTWVVWATKNTGASLKLPSAPLAVFDVQGNALTANQTISVSPVPVFVELAH